MLALGDDDGEDTGREGRTHALHSIVVETSDSLSSGGRCLFTLVRAITDDQSLFHELLIMAVTLPFRGVSRPVVRSLVTREEGKGLSYPAHESIIIEKNKGKKKKC